MPDEKGEIIQQSTGAEPCLAAVTSLDPDKDSRIPDRVRWTYLVADIHHQSIDFPGLCRIVFINFDHKHVDRHGIKVYRLQYLKLRTFHIEGEKVHLRLLLQIVHHGFAANGVVRVRSPITGGGVPLPIVPTFAVCRSSRTVFVLRKEIDIARRGLPFLRESDESSRRSADSAVNKLSPRPIKLCIGFQSFKARDVSFLRFRVMSWGSVGGPPKQTYDKNSAPVQTGF